MKISQILNNNVALVKKGSSEIIVYAKGLAFKKKVGQSISIQEIERTYVLDSHRMLEHFSHLLTHMDEQYIILINELIAFGEQKLKQKAHDYLYLTLLDHISQSIQRAAKGQFIRSPLIWEVKRFYPEHFKVGQYAVELIKKMFGAEFPEDEAVSVALHFVNLQQAENHVKDAIETMDVLRDIVSIVQYHFTIQLDNNSFHYMRFMTHLQYFLLRVMNHERNDDNDAALYKQISVLYNKAYGCVQKIKVYLRERYQHEITLDEETYLILHIQQITTKGERKDSI